MTFGCVTLSAAIPDSSSGTKSAAAKVRLALQITTERVRSMKAFLVATLICMTHLRMRFSQ
jgi:hypothetical protein